MKGHFPAVKFAIINTPEKQMSHVLSEAREVESESYDDFGFSNKDVEWAKVDEEMADLLHSCETYFRIREREGLNVDELFANVVEKNRKRGYYI